MGMQATEARNGGKGGCMRRDAPAGSTPETSPLCAAQHAETHTRAPTQLLKGATHTHTHTHTHPHTHTHTQGAHATCWLGKKCAFDLVSMTVVQARDRRGRRTSSLRATATSRRSRRVRAPGHQR